MAAALAVLYSLATAQSAPTNFSQRRVANDEAALSRVFDRFERWPVSFGAFGPELAAAALAARRQEGGERGTRSTVVR